MKKKCERSLGFKIIFDDIHSKLEATQFSIPSVTLRDRLSFFINYYLLFFCV